MHFEINFSILKSIIFLLKQNDFDYYDIIFVEDRLWIINISLLLLYYNFIPFVHMF